MAAFRLNGNEASSSINRGDFLTVFVLASKEDLCSMELVRCNLNLH